MISDHNLNEIADILAHRNVIQEVLDYIHDNVDPDDIYSKEDLKEFVRDEYSPREVYSTEELVEAIDGIVEPEDIFSISDLQDWAINAGYVEAPDYDDYYEDR